MNVTRIARIRSPKTGVSASQMLEARYPMAEPKRKVTEM